MVRTLTAYLGLRKDWTSPVTKFFAVFQILGSHFDSGNSKLLNSPWQKYAFFDVIF